MNDGEQYEVDFGDGVRAVYRPWSDKNHYAQRGELEIIIDERPDTKSLDKALGNIEKLGLKTNIADAEDAEIMYLTKQAYITKADRDQDYMRMISGLDGRNATKTERIQTMRGFWEKRLGVSDITRMPGYDPVGEYQLGFKDAKIAGGYRHQYRFDISDADLEKQMKGYLNNPDGIYVARENELTQGVESTKIYVQMNIPSGCSLNWFASNDGGETWEPMTLDTTREIDQTWTEYVFLCTFVNPAGNRVRYKAVMTGSNLIYPRIHSLGATLS